MASSNKAIEPEKVEKSRQNSQDSSDRAQISPKDGLRTVSTQSQPTTPVRKVARRSREGLLGCLSVLYEAEEPRHYPRRVKWFLTFVIALATVAGPMGSAIIYPSLNDIVDEFHTKPTIANLSVALYLLAMAIFPLWWSAYSETAGRRAVYIISFAFLAVWNLLAALSSSITMFIAMRFLSGAASASVQAVGAGTMADCWDTKERGRAVSWVMMGHVAGPLMSPLIGGALTERFGWRSIMWFQVIFGGVVLLVIIFGLPETHKKNKREATIKSVSAQPQNGDGVQGSLSQPSANGEFPRRSAIEKIRNAAAFLRRVFVDPLKMVLHLRFPAVALTIWYSSIDFAFLYYINISVQKTFSAPPFKFNSTIIGCLYLFNSFGYFVASVGGGYWVDHIMRRAARKAGRFDSGGKPRLLPEDRMGENVWTAALFIPTALIWYGWTAQQHIHWVVPMIANFFYGVGLMLLFSTATTMLTEFMPKSSSSGVALNNCARNIFAFLGTFLAEPMIDALGNGWVFTILGSIAAANLIIIVLMKRNSVKWRIDMDKRMP